MKSQDFAAMLQTLVEYLAKLMDADSALIPAVGCNPGQIVPATAYGSLRQAIPLYHFEAGGLTAATSALNSGRVLEVRGWPIHLYQLENCDSVPDQIVDGSAADRRQ